MPYFLSQQVVFDFSLEYFIVYVLWATPKYLNLPDRPNVSSGPGAGDIENLDLGARFEVAQGSGQIDLVRLFSCPLLPPLSSLRPSVPLLLPSTLSPLLSLVIYLLPVIQGYQFTKKKSICHFFLHLIEEKTKINFVTG